MKELRTPRRGLHSEMPLLSRLPYHGSPLASAAVLVQDVAKATRQALIRARTVNHQCTQQILLFGGGPFSGCPNSKSPTEPRHDLESRQNRGDEFGGRAWAWKVSEFKRMFVHSRAPEGRSSRRKDVLQRRKPMDFKSPTRARQHLSSE